MLDEVYQPWVEEHYPNGNVFEQDGVPSHTAPHTKVYFLSEGMDVLRWPSKSPDQNCIENIWGLLVRRVYQGNRQFYDIDDLKECLIYEWDSLSIAEVRNIIESMPRCVVECLANKGGLTSY